MNKGRFITEYRDKWRVRVPGKGEVLFHIEAIHAAIDERDRLCEIVGIDPYDLVKSNSGGWLGRPFPMKVHTDLPMGLTRTHDKYKDKKYFHIVALIGTKFQKKFYYGKKRTEKQAIELAKIWADTFKNDI